MKKFNATKMMALLMALCLITSTFVGSTLAKYTTSAEASDSARVAKFGVVVTAAANAFAEEYDTDNTTVATTIAKSVIGKDGSNAAKVVAPGTEGTLATTTITGTPEVAVNVKKEATLTLTGWEAKGKNADGVQDTTASYYCPLEITVNGTTFKGTSYTSAADFIADVEAAIECDKNYEPNTNLASTDDVTVTWAWAFTGNDDVKDTYLGDQAATATAATVDFEITTTVTQID